MTRYRVASDMDSWRADPRIVARGFNHPWTSTVADGNGEDFFIELVDEHLRSDHDVLDVGCGHGELAMAVALRCRSAVGLDRDDRVIELARELAAERTVTNIRFDVAELAGPGEDRPGGPLPLADASIDLVIDRRGPLIQRFIDDLRRVVRPGAVVIGMHPAGGPPPPPWAEDVPSLRHRFQPIGQAVVESWVTEPARERGIGSYRLWWIDVPEYLPDPRSVYDRLRDDHTPPFDQLRDELEAAFRRRGREDGLQVRHQRLVFAINL